MERTQDAKGTDPELAAALKGLLDVKSLIKEAQDAGLFVSAAWAKYGMAIRKLAAKDYAEVENIAKDIRTSLAKETTRNICVESLRPIIDAVHEMKKAGVDTAALDAHIQRARFFMAKGLLDDAFEETKRCTVEAERIREQARMQEPETVDAGPAEHAGAGPAPTVGEGLAEHAADVSVDAGLPAEVITELFDFAGPKKLAA